MQVRLNFLYKQKKHYIPKYHEVAQFVTWLSHGIGGTIKLLRGEWFEVISDKWYPIEEDEAKQIEAAHCSTAWRLKV